MIAIAILVYCFLVIRFVVTLNNCISKPFLPYSSQPHTELVSILVPARNEALNIPHLLASIQQQEYSNYELIVLDDDSSDETAAIINQFVTTEPRCKLISGKPLPEGWLGKNWACHQLAMLASGKYLLFVDADVRIGEGFIRSAIQEMKRKNLSLLSVFNDQVMLSAGEKMVVPLMHYLLLTLLPLRLVYSTKNHQIAAASGQCMLFEAEAYHTHQFHQQAKAEVVEDIYIMQRVKKAGLTGAACLANGLIHCRMYSSYQEAIAGFSKNLMAGFGNRVWVTSIYIMLITVGYLAFLSPDVTQLFPGRSALFLFYGSVLFFIVSIRVMVSWLSNQNIFVNLWFHPVHMITIQLLLLISIYKRITHTNKWKGRRISTK
ncbi:glycosyltransferase [Rhodocytophaga rosea]|uniref:Glycosyltransferase n=1 Tax=Rhodocytophaga rosea TaxID=2704465 RepID=A0A6C0GHP4_9BACT|nr:glycosyltransferase family 2 protein [Rhodocytophaga rosea]QHT67467.1 glycosyltransferase [Rhodocytophaga rosea]